ncbi:MAG: hypothetical protein ACJAWW_000192 [Sulfurimonas sp.]|jgi:hypothetical protein
MKTIILSILMLGATVMFAQDQSRREPPKEAITACENKASGDTCSITTPKGNTLEGTCKNTPDDKYFVCMPENMPNDRPQ